MIFDIVRVTLPAVRLRARAQPAAPWRRDRIRGAPAAVWGCTQRYRALARAPTESVSFVHTGEFGSPPLMIVSIVFADVITDELRMVAITDASPSADQRVEVETDIAIVFWGPIRLTKNTARRTRKRGLALFPIPACLGKAMRIAIARVQGVAEWLA
jgi:hypothetical protein